MHSELITLFANHLLGAGFAQGTVNLRVLHITQLLTVGVRLDRITTEDLERFLAERRTTHSAETRKSIRASFRVFFAWAHKKGVIPTDPSADLLPIHVNVAVPRLAPDDVIQRSLEGAPLHEQGMILLGRLACLRLSEITYLRVENREGWDLRVFGKGDKTRLVGINDDLMPILRAIERRVGGSGWYFPGLIPGNPFHPQSVHKIIKRRTGWHPHSLRHAGATAAYRSTRDLRAVQDMLGHASLATTERYLHLDEDSRRAAAQGTSFRRAA